MFVIDNFRSDVLRYLIADWASRSKLERCWFLRKNNVDNHLNPTYQAFVTLQPDWLPFNSLGAGVANKRQYKTTKVPDLPDWLPFNSMGAGVANKRQYKTAKVPDLPHIFSLTKLQAHTFILPNFLLYWHQNATQVTRNLGNFQIQM